MKITLWTNGKATGAKMGRKRNDAAVREPNGRASRKAEHVSQREWEARKDAMSVALEARQRVFGVTEEQALDPFAGTLLGRMLQKGEISQAQMDAASRYIEVRSQYHRAIGCKPWHNQTRPEGEGTQTYEEVCAAAKEKHESMEAVILAVCVEERTGAPRTALEHIVIRDVQMPMLNGYLRSVLNRLHAHFFVSQRRAA